MRVTADTNVLVRAITGDDPKQARIAQTELAQAEAVAIAIPALCELVWVLDQGYKISLPQISQIIRDLLDSANVIVNRPAAEAGLSLLDAGGDFADGVIAFDGRRLGADMFVSFDKQAVKLLEAQGERARQL